MSDQPSFEAALAEVEQIVRALEDGATGLEESLARYERGVELLKVCYGHLRAAESRIAILAGVDGDGKPLLKPFDHTAAEQKNRPTSNSRPGLY